MTRITGPLGKESLKYIGELFSPPRGGFSAIALPCPGPACLGTGPLTASFPLRGTAQMKSSWISALTEKEKCEFLNNASLSFFYSSPPLFFHFLSYCFYHEEVSLRGPSVKAFLLSRFLSHT